MMARNFRRHGFDLFHPQIDWAGAGPGYVGSELPLVPWLIALVCVDEAHIVIAGRLLAIAMWAASAVFFARLVAEWKDERTALFASLFYCVSPLGIYYSRTLMPESAMMAATLLAVLAFGRWMRSGSCGQGTVALVAATLALLVKLPALFVAPALAVMAARRPGRCPLRDPALWLFAAVALLPSVLWYRHAFALASHNYPYHMFGEDTWIWRSGLGELVSLANYRRVGLHALAFVLAPPALVLAAAGALSTWREGVSSRVFHAWTLGLLVHVVLAFPGHRHEYYQLPFVPPLAAFAGAWVSSQTGSAAAAHGRSGAWTRGLTLGALVLSLPLALGIAASRYRSPADGALWAAGLEIARRTPPGALVAAADGGNPVLLYAANRRGWHFPGQDVFTAPELPWTPRRVEELRARGAMFLVSASASAGRVAGIDQTLLQRLGARLLPIPPIPSLEAHPDLSAWLDARYPHLVSGPEAVIYDLRELPDGLRER